MRPCACGLPVRLSATRLRFNRRQGVSHAIEHLDGSAACGGSWTCSAFKPYPKREEEKEYYRLMQQWEEAVMLSDEYFEEFNPDPEYFRTFHQHAAPEAIQAELLRAVTLVRKAEARVDWLQKLQAKRATQVMRGEWPPKKTTDDSGASDRILAVGV